MKARLPLLLALLFVLHAVHAAQAASGGLHVIVTFPSLVPDVEQLACKGDVVEALVPPSVDPHEYQLTPSDVEKLRSADLIVSTGHAPFEKRIEELVEEGVVRARLFVVWRVEGVHLLRNPVTGQVNLHMPIYDPRNYIAFIRALARVMGELRPECSSFYTGRAEAIAARLEELIAKAPRLQAPAVADMPFVQYAVEWLGLRVEALLVPQPGLPATSALVEEARRVLAGGGVAVVTEPVKAAASKRLLGLAAEYGAPVIRVPSPLVPKPIPEKLEYIVEQVERVKGARGVAAAVVIPDWVLWLGVVLSASLAFGALSTLVAARRLYFLAAGLPHSSLLAATIAIPLSAVIGGPEYLWAAAAAVVLAHLFSLLVEKGVDPDVAASVFVSATASASVAAMYYVLSRFSLQAELWAYILGDPLLVDPGSVLLAVCVACATLLATILVYREEVCIGLDPNGARLAGIRVKLYDAILVSMLAAVSVLLLRIVGFVVEHVLVLLPGAVAVTAARGMWRALLYALAAAVIAGVAGLALALTLGVAPAAAIGGVMVTLYAASLVYRARR